MWYSPLLKYIPLLALILTVSSFIFIQGYKSGNGKCDSKIKESEELWKNKIAELNTANENILLAYQNKKLELETLERTKRKEILKYVEKDPTSDTIIFSNDILQLINND